VRVTSTAVEMTERSATRRCLLCGAADLSEVRESTDRRFNLPGRFKVLWCPHCDVGATHPRLSLQELRQYYPDKYDPYCDDISVSDQSRLHRFLVSAERRFGPAATDRVIAGALLDVGCGNGAYMADMARRGFNVTGIELSPVASGIVAKRGLPVVTGDFLTCEFPRQSFDVITMNHYLEHSLDPRASLTKAWELLREGGSLIVGVPNFTSWASRHYGSDWSDLDLPRHAFHFSPRGLVRLLESCGFRVEHTRYESIADGGSIATSLLVKTGKRTDLLSQRLYPLLHAVCYPAGVPLSLFRRSAWIRVFSSKHAFEQSRIFSDTSRVQRGSSCLSLSNRHS
jgi:SAM-dependent methyltransferase